MTFEDQLIQTIRKKVIGEIKTLSLTRLDYNSRAVIPSEIMDKVYSSINWDEVLEQIRPAIQTRICNAIVGAMETEVKTDVKKLLSVDGVRQKLRMEVYPQLMQSLNSTNLSSEG